MCRWHFPVDDTHSSWFHYLRVLAEDGDDVDESFEELVNVEQDEGGNGAVAAIYQ